MIPLVEEYVKREYTMEGNHLMLTSEHSARGVIEQKVRKVSGMIK